MPSKTEQVILHSQSAGFLWFGRAFDHPALCDVVEFEGERPAPADDSSAEFVISPAELAFARRYAHPRTPVQVLDPTREHKSVAETAHKARLLDDDLARKRAQLAETDRKLREMTAAMAAAETRATDAEKRAAEAMADADKARAALEKAEKARPKKKAAKKKAAAKAESGE